MTTNRLEAFSDGVLAIVITIMVLELKVPEGASLATLKPLMPKFLSYVLSFIMIGIYWNNHHHLFHAIKQINGKILWANLSLLFCLSLLPFTTGWMGENHFESIPVVLYGINLFLCAITFSILERLSIHYEGKKSVLYIAIASQKKELLSTLAYVVGILISLIYPLAGILCYCLVMAAWIIPDKRIEKQLN